MVRAAAALRWMRPDLTATLAELALETTPDAAVWISAAGWLLHGRAALGDGRQTACDLLDGLGRWGATGELLMAGPVGRRLRVELAGPARRIGEPGVARALLSADPGLDDGDPALRADVLTELARCAVDDAPGVADDALAAADRAWRHVACPPGVGSVMLLVAARQRRAGNADEAIRQAVDGLRCVNAGGRRAGATASDHVAAALTAEWIAALTEAGRLEDASGDALSAANRLIAAARTSRQVAGLRLALARVSAVADSPDAVLAALEAAAGDAADSDVPELEAACRTMLGGLHESAGRLDAALVALRAAMAAEHRDRDRGARLRARLAAVAATWAATPSHGVAAGVSSVSRPGRHDDAAGSAAAAGPRDVPSHGVPSHGAAAPGRDTAAHNGAAVHHGTARDGAAYSGAAHSSAAYDGATYSGAAHSSAAHSSAAHSSAAHSSAAHSSAAHSSAAYDGAARSRTAHNGTGHGAAGHGAAGHDGTAFDGMGGGRRARPVAGRPGDPADGGRGAASRAGGGADGLPVAAPHDIGSDDGREPGRARRRVDDTGRSGAVPRSGGASGDPSVTSRFLASPHRDATAGEWWAGVVGGSLIGDALLREFAESAADRGERTTSGRDRTPGPGYGGTPADDPLFGADPVRADRRGTAGRLNGRDPNGADPNHRDPNHRDPNHRDPNHRDPNHRDPTLSDDAHADADDPSVIDRRTARGAGGTWSDDPSSVRDTVVLGIVIEPGTGDPARPGENARPDGPTTATDAEAHRTDTADGPAEPAPQTGEERGPRSTRHGSSRRAAGRPPSTDTDGLGLADLLAGALAAYRDL